MAEYANSQKAEKFEELKAKQSKLDEKIKQAEAIMIMPKATNNGFREIKAAHGNLKTQKQALDLEMTKLSFIDKDKDMTPNELYFVFDGHYYFFWGER